MHAKPDLRVFLKWLISGSGSVITDVIRHSQPNSIGERYCCAMKSRHWYQISVLDLIVIAAVAAIIVRLNFVGHDVGSGFSIIDYGFPFPILTDHSEFGRSVDGIALLID